MDIYRAINRLDLRMRPERHFFLSLTIFVLTFFVLQYSWGQAKGTQIERLVIDRATVGTSVTLINTLTPGIEASARGASIKAAGGGINIRNGCEGTEIWFLLVAALVASPFSWRIRLIGVLLGAGFVFFLNQLRILTLFYSARSDRALFDQLHGLVAPLTLVACMFVFFLVLKNWDRRTRTASSV